MANYSITTTPQQDVVIGYVLRARNAERARQEPALPPLDVQGLINEYLDRVVEDNREVAIQQARDQLIELYEAADPSARARVDQALGRTPVPGP